MSSPKNKLVFDQNTEGMYETFGYSKALMDDVKDAFRDFFIHSLLETREVLEKAKEENRLNRVLDEVHKGQVKGVATSYTEVLESFLESKGFKNLGFKLDSPNAYFVLGMLFRLLVDAIKESMEEMNSSETERKVKKLVEDLLN